MFEMQQVPSILFNKYALDRDESRRSECRTFSRRFLYRQRVSIVIRYYYRRRPSVTDSYGPAIFIIERFPDGSGATHKTPYVQSDTAIRDRVIYRSLKNAYENRRLRFAGYCERNLPDGVCIIRRPCTGHSRGHNTLRYCAWESGRYSDRTLKKKKTKQ